MSTQPNSSGAALRTLRRIAGITLDQAAGLGGTSAAYLSKVENGVFVPTRGYVARVAASIAEYITREQVANLTDKVPA